MHAARDVLCPQDASDAAVTHILEGLPLSQPFADAPPAVRVLHGAGVRVASMTNGSAATTQHFLERAGMSELVKPQLQVHRLWLATHRGLHTLCAYNRAQRIVSRLLSPGERCALLLTAAHMDFSLCELMPRKLN